MNLISQIFLIILIACFTGTVSLGFWRVFQPLLLKRDPRLVYATLRFVCMMYIVPFGYLIVRLTWRGYLRTESIWKPNFEMAGEYGSRVWDSRNYLAGLSDQKCRRQHG